ncbi:hypothetical protein I6J24_06755 [Corynebacterium kroppenstedtii]|uniref:hypothetical protein n=1 Tax=Corynebacterium pseudokroppenstedtii TaxID=2804917 RepID=UPI0019526DEB|nr:hypothetical protein [Corynebacterium pseudokroppenstedtii]MDK7147242.1 hypothetical protein [Corynebacterium pseudokroppenstedtii]QRP13818.1 hypothetical protein I6J24_06755 [Corynebacterium kroppenstedtii]
MTKALKSIVGFLTFALVVRGLDYVTGTADGHAESDLPPLVWGTTCIVVGIVVVVGLVSRQTRIIIAGSLMASAIYVMFAVYQVPLIFQSSPPPDDWRTCGDYVALAGMWAVVCVTLALRFHVAQVRRGGDSGDVASIE